MKAVAVPRAVPGARRRLSEVIDAAAKVFARRGYHGASTQDIADLLGMRQASLYYYFDSKEAALEAVCQDVHEGYVECIRRIARSDATASEKVAQVLLQAARAVKLLGAQVVLTGLRPEIAQTLVSLGVDLGDIVTRGRRIPPTPLRTATSPVMMTGCAPYGRNAAASGIFGTSASRR